ncbi:hypothetical protein [Sphaerisporangium sp. TRM90804]|uniref:hypothetical protein n=1 Tax=Sphaerisporangium sp. TRM90804 TaxID=3031113 RepID=UPI002446D9CC|nr:hypothetical protein [Sphaerisporangium sp. TRM90804]MDH2425140.1 hypothetical protein [Sphaerisporangium sp. TRM90804]
MLVAAAVCPCPPLLVPRLAGAAAPELAGLREACAGAVRSLTRSAPDALLVVGGAETAESYDSGAGGTFAPWGADVRVGEGPPVLPLSLTVGRWLLDLAGAGCPSGYEAVPCDAATRECLRLGALLAGRAPRVALLVVGDGSARLAAHSPGYLHPRAAPYDAALTAALAAADVPALAALDPAEADELWVGGRAAFQVLAGAAAAGGADAPAFRGQLLHHQAPYGVGYPVARWTRQDPGGAS